jgi:hypothetical protein
MNRFISVLVTRVGFVVVGAFVGSLCTSCARSSASVEGKIGDRDVFIGGTVFGWLDETRYEVDDGALALRDRGTDETVLYVTMTGAQFDPAVDFRTLPIERRAQISDDVSSGYDSLSMTIHRGNRLEEGDTLTYDSEDFDIPDNDAYLSSISLRLGRQALTSASTYPDEVDVIASERVVDLDVEAKTDERLTGTMTFEIVKANGDNRDNVIEATLQIRFDVELLPERLAECNFSNQGAGVVDPCADLDFAE